MKSIFKTIAFIILIFTFSCNERNTESIDSPQSSRNEKNISMNARNSSGDSDLVNSLRARYNIETQVNEDGSYVLHYADGTFLDVKPTSESTCIISGSKTPGLVMEIHHIENDNFEFDVKQDTNGLLAKPCAQHPKNESFNQCFKREWSEFCDGLIGCVAQATNPLPVAAAISLHCALC